MEAQREELERPRKQIQFEIEMLGEIIRELGREKEGVGTYVQGQTQENRSVLRQRTPEERDHPSPKGRKKTPHQAQRTL